MKKLSNDLILQFVSLVIFFIIVMFAFSIFLGGHYSPGGGFVGGLLLAGALLLILIAYDIKTLERLLPVDFKIVTAVGLMIAFATPIIAVLNGKPFFTHFFGDLYLPLFGNLHWHTAMLFDLGVMLVVVGTTITIILTIGENE